MMAHFLAAADNLASLPRNTAYRLLPVEALKPVQDGIGWYYRGIIRYEPKNYVSEERIERDRIDALDRVRKACVHARWGRFPWRIEGDACQRGPQHNTDNLLSSQVRQVPQESCGLILPISVDLPNEPTEPTTPALPPEGEVRKVADKLKPISESSRLAILLFLISAERNVTEICNALGSASQPAVSHQLSIMRGAGLVDADRVGQHRYYKLTNEGIELADLAKRLLIA